MSILEQAEGYLAGTGGMCVEDAARTIIELVAAAKEVVDADKSAISISIGGNLQGAIEKLAEKLEELQ